MQTLKKRSNFLGSQEALDISHKLSQMTSSDLYNTASSFTVDDARYPDNLIPFLDKHLNYLNAHPMLDAGMYLANLRLMTRIR